MIEANGHTNGGDDGGSGGRSEVNHYKTDIQATRLEALALKEGWPIPDWTEKQRIVDEAVVRAKDNANPRQADIAFRNLMSSEQSNRDARGDVPATSTTTNNTVVQLIGDAPGVVENILDRLRARANGNGHTNGESNGSD
tara:strand:- start:24044 stop:24463 length:420 start_codon:yes stop_codon:yes gene_type:complete